MLGRGFGAPHRDITEALWGLRVSSGPRNLNKKIYAQTDAWRNRRIEDKNPYVYLDGIVLKRSWAGENRSVSLLLTISVNAEDYREILGISEGAKGEKTCSGAFLKHLKARGLKGVQLVISDACTGLVERPAEVFPAARWQRCVVHWYRNVFTHVPAAKLREVSLMLKAIHASKDRQAALAKTDDVVSKLRALRLSRAAELVEATATGALVYYAFPNEHRRRIRTNNPREYLIREIRRSTRVVGAFPDGESALNLAIARLRYIAGSCWGQRRYLNIDPLKQREVA